MTNDIHRRLCAVETLLGIKTNTCEVSKTTRTFGRFTVSNIHPSSRPQKTKKVRFIVSNIPPSSRPKRDVNRKRDVSRNMEERKKNLIQSMPRNPYRQNTRNAMKKPRYNGGLTWSI